jgi:RNA polymerase sigma-70 factor (ECF subfamily)
VIGAQDRMAGLWSSYGGQVWRAMFAASAGRRDLADDVTAEAFARLIAYQRSVDDPLAWLFRTAYRLLNEELRRERDTGGATLESAVFSGGEMSPALTAALVALDPKQRLCVFLHYYADLPIGEVARLTGSTQSAVKVRLHRARQKLRTTLERTEAVRV